jgi:hypothetical protein
VYIGISVSMARGFRVQPSDDSCEKECVLGVGREVEHSKRKLLSPPQSNALLALLETWPGPHVTWSSYECIVYEIRLQKGECAQCPNSVHQLVFATTGTVSANLPDTLGWYMRWHLEVTE